MVLDQCMVASDWPYTMPHPNTAEAANACLKRDHFIHSIS